MELVKGRHYLFRFLRAPSLFLGKACSGSTWTLQERNNHVKVTRIDETNLVGMATGAFFASKEKVNRKQKVCADLN